MKVFCSECRFFVPEYNAVYNPGQCKYPENTKEEIATDTWRFPGECITRYLRHPSDINVLNQCTWYEEN